MSRWRGARSVTSRPPIEISPLVTSSRPAIARSSVDLPQPDGPTSAMNSPSADPQRDVVERDDISGEDLGDVPKLDLRHGAGYGYHISPAIGIDHRLLRVSVDSPDGRRRAGHGGGKRPGGRLRARATLELVELMNAADATVPAAVAAAASSIAAAVDAIAERLRAGGRLVYVGAGSSGRIAALDASECEATFSTRPGHRRRARRRRRGRDPARPGRRRGRPRRRQPQTSQALAVGPADAVVGVSASGTTPVRARRARGGARGRRAHRVRRLGARLRARRARRARDRRRRRPGVPRRLDAPQGRHGAEARAQHDLDDLDDSPRQDVRKPHGGRRRGEREARTSASGGSSRAATGASPEQVDEALAAADGDAPRRDRLAPRAASTPTTARAALDASGRSIAAALERAVRLGVEAALVDGSLVAGDVEILERARRRLRPRVAERPRHRRARLRRPPGERLRRRRLPHRRRRGLPAGG